MNSLFITSDALKVLKGGLYQDSVMIIYRIVNVGFESIRFLTEYTVNTKIINTQPVEYCIRPGEQVSIQLVMMPRPVIDISIHFRSGGEIIQSTTATIDTAAISASGYYDPVLDLDRELASYLMQRFTDAFKLGKIMVVVQDYLDIGWDKSHKDEIMHQLILMQDILMRMGYYVPPVEIETIQDFLIYVQRIMEGIPSSLQSNVTKHNGGNTDYDTDQPIRSSAH